MTWRAVETSPGCWIVTDGVSTLPGEWRGAVGKARAEFRAIKANLKETDDDS